MSVAVVTMSDVVAAVGAYYEVSRVDLQSSRRTSELVEPRHIACYVGATITCQSLPQIGSFLKRDHTTILHARDKIAGMIKNDEALAEKVNAIALAAETMARLRGERIYMRAESRPPLDVAREISGRGARAACAASVEEILEICDELIAVSQPAPQPPSRYLIADLSMRQKFFMARPTLANRRAREAAVDSLRDPDRQSDVFVAALVSAFDHMRKNEFTMAEKQATQQFNDIMRRAEVWLERHSLSGETK